MFSEGKLLATIAREEVLKADDDYRGEQEVLKTTGQATITITVCYFFAVRCGEPVYESEARQILNQLYFFGLVTLVWLC